MRYSLLDLQHRGIGMNTAGYWLEYCAAEMERAGLFFGHGTDNAHDEAAWMLLHVLGLPLDDSFEDWGRVPDEAAVQRLKTLLARRVGERVPLAYLTGECRFCDLDFAVTPDVLVPRSPLAELIRERFSPWLEIAPGDRLLDMCTGGGCIAIAMAWHMPGVYVDAVDLCTGALQVAAQNVARHRLQERVRLVQSDLFSALGGQRYKLIVSNPPYVSAAAFAALPPEYHAEPGSGLVSGQDGLDIVLKMLDACPAYLAEDGVLIVEVGESASTLVGLLPRAPFLWLEFQHGGDGVFMLEYDQLVACQADLKTALERRKNVG
jgi:ribosomal protein L3 glutamine methyltransferase